jgi:hypothetical protein
MLGTGGGVGTHWKRTHVSASLQGGEQSVVHVPSGPQRKLLGHDGSQVPSAARAAPAQQAGARTSQPTDRISV